MVWMSLSVASFGQVTITADGQKVESLKCEMKNVHLSFVLPANYKNYEKIEVALKMTSPENNSSNPYIYGVVYSSGYFEGKKTIEVDLANDKEGSEFYKGLLQFQLDASCYDPMRTYTYLQDIFYINGAVHNGWEYKDDKKVKKYSWETIKEYKVKHEIGPVLDFYYGANRAFTIDKVNFGEIELSHAGNNTYGTFNEVVSDAPEAFDFGAPAPKVEVGDVKFVAEVFSAKDHSVDACKKGVELGLIRSSNSSFQISGGDVPFDHQSNFFAAQTYLPVTPAGVTAEGNEAKALKAKGGKLSKSENEALLQQLPKNSGKYFNWKEAKLGNLSVQKLEIDVYESEQITSNDAWATYVKSDEQGKTRKLLVYIGQKGDQVFCVALYKTQVEGLTDEENQFIQLVEKTFKAL